MITLDALVAILVSGVVLGSLYALMASGLSLIWSTLRIFNFAHGAILMSTAYVAWTMESLGLPTWAALIVAVVLGALLSVVLEFLLVRPFLKRDDAVLITTVTLLAGSIFLVSAVQIIWGPRVKQLGRLASGSVELLSSAIGWQDIVIIVVAPLSLLAVAFVLKRTRLGFAVRAVEENRDRARLVGISPTLVYVLSMALGGALAGLAGVLLGSILTLTPTMGNDPLLRAFVVVVFGGLGSLPGTVVGAYAVGLIEASSVYFVGLYWAPVILFLILILVLAIRPQGLMGRDEG